MKKILLIINPSSGRAKIQTELLNVIKEFNKNNFETNVQITLAPKHAIEIVKNANNIDAIICSGGDGTLNEIITGLINANKNIPIGYIPAGSTNDFAMTFGLPLNILDATKQIINGTPRAIDIGQFNKDRYFSYVASFGAFSSVSYSTPQPVKNTLGHLAYVFNGIADIGNIKPYTVKITTHNDVYKDDFVFGAILNTTSVGGLIKLDNINVDLQDGLFEVILVKTPKTLTDLNDILYGISNVDFSNNIFKFIKTDKLTLEFTDPPNWALDGEEAKGTKKVEILNLNKKIKIIK